MHGGRLAGDLHVGDAQEASVRPDIAVTATLSVCAHVANRLEPPLFALLLKRKDTAFSNSGLRVPRSRDAIDVLAAAA